VRRSRNVGVNRLRVAGRSTWVAVTCLLCAGAFYLWSLWHANRMDLRAEGWEMAFYFSPLAFLVMDGLLLLAGVLAVVGALAGPRWYHRAVAVSAGLVAMGWFTQLPWH
jgi:hypothetical protein